MHYRATVIAFFAISAGAFGQHLVVTAEGRHGAEPPEVMRDDVSVEVNKRPARVTEWVPLRGDRAALELYIVIDDGDDTDLGLQYGSLKKFIHQQPATTHIGLAYLQNGSARIAAPLTASRDEFAKALRLPLGMPGASSSPYIAISELMKKWPAADARREILLISSGIDPLAPANPDSLYLQNAIEDAQRGGILVNSMYIAGAGHAAHSFRLANWGQNYLSEAGEETGGEAYWQGANSQVTFDPWLKDFSARLQQQYLLTIGPPDAAQSEKNDLQPVRVTAVQSGVSLVSASKIRLATGP